MELQIVPVSINLINIGIAKLQLSTLIHPQTL